MVMILRAPECLRKTVARATAELLTARAELESRVEQRTAQLLETEEEQRRLAIESEVLTEIGRIINSTLDIDIVLVKCRSYFRLIGDPGVGIGLGFSMARQMSCED